MPTPPKEFQFQVLIRFEAKGETQARQRCHQIMKLLENGSPAESLADLGIEARFVEAKNLTHSHG